MTKAGQLITDGDAVWIIDDVRDGARVGDIILRPTLRDGYIKANGATVKAPEYDRHGGAVHAGLLQVRV